MTISKIEIERQNSGWHQLCEKGKKFQVFTKTICFELDFDFCGNSIKLIG